MDKVKTNEKFSKRQKLISLTPIIGLVILLILYVVIGIIKDINFKAGFEAIVNQSVILAIVATGAIFIFTLGSFDISLGASTLVSACAGGLVYNATGSVALMLLTCVAASLAASLVSSVLGSIFNLPVFVTTVAMMSVLSAVSEMLITGKGGNQIRISGLSGLENIWVKLIFLVIFTAICVFVFEFTKVGRRQKALGGNPVCAKLTGISVKTYAILAFIMAGVGIGLGGFLTAVRASTITSGTASDIGMNIFIAIVFGGMPISGGPRSRIYAAIIGSFSIRILSQILTMLLAAVPGANGIAQIVRAIFFLAMVYLASMNYRTKMLPR
ncbi:MAG: inner-membrane translocator [Clostridia bacterium]|nr:inner-membrane translocator [Clostridia bacterium]